MVVCVEKVPYKFFFNLSFGFGPWVSITPLFVLYLTMIPAADFFKGWDEYHTEFNTEGGGIQHTAFSNLEYVLLVLFDHFRYIWRSSDLAQYFPQALTTHWVDWFSHDKK